jgi:NAD(P)H-nitrite reductase large subunit
VILCHCAVVTDRDLAACVHEGARTVGQVVARTGAGQGCGGCVLAVRACTKTLLGQDGRLTTPAAVLEDTRAAG